MWTLVPFVLFFLPSVVGDDSFALVRGFSAIGVNNSFGIKAFFFVEYLAAFGYLS